MMEIAVGEHQLAAIFGEERLDGIGKQIQEPCYGSGVRPLQGVAFPKHRATRKQSDTSPLPLGEIQEMAPGKLVHLVPQDLVARSQKLSGIESFISIASKTAAIAYRASIGSTKPHARIALEMSSLSSVFGNSSSPAMDSSSSYRRSSNRATLSSVMRTFKSAKGWLTSGVGHMRSVEGSKNSLFILSIGAPLLCARVNAAVIASVHVGGYRLLAEPHHGAGNRAPQWIRQFCRGAVAVFLILRARQRAIDQCPWGKAKLSVWSADTFQIRNVQKRS